MSRPQLSVIPGGEPASDELDLFARWVARRDEGAVAVLWRRHERVAMHLAARVLHRQPDALEAAREVCDDAFVQALSTFQPKRAADVDAPFRAWFLRLCRQRAIDRLRRAPPPGDADAVLSTAPDQEDALAAVRDLAHLRAWVLEHFLPSDWDALADRGRGYAWSDIAARNPVGAPADVLCAPGRVAPEGAWVDAVLGVLNASPGVVLRVVGVQTEEGPDAVDGLALRRAKAVRDALTARAPATAQRLRVAGEEDAVGHRVRFEIVDGGTRTAAAQRVRQQALLKRYLDTAGRPR